MEPISNPVRDASRYGVATWHAARMVMLATVRAFWLLLAWLWWAWKGTFRGLLYFVLIVFTVFLAQIFFFTPLDVAYRYSIPGTDPCDAQRRSKTVLADEPVQNDELAAKRLHPELAVALTCMLQEHELPVPANTHWPNGAAMGPIRYFLSFVEFLQDGRPAEKGPDGQTLQREQLDVLLQHLKTIGAHGQNYVLVFIHGWRHDASIGDDNVRDVRVIAAHVASFLDYRCKIARRYCNAVVTAVYIGWRGARVHEAELREKLGERLGAVTGTILATPTLFDRKPVSEQIGPAAIAALSQIDATLMENNKVRTNSADKELMIIFGHSLGGNMLASALKETMAMRILRHQPESVMTAPLGNLIVLLNPASEASNWTALQRAMRQRVFFDGSFEERVAGHKFFPPQQPPIYMALTSAYAWPVAPVREADKKDPAVMSVINQKTAEFRTRVDYDWATHDLFPAFKDDFRPLSDTLAHWASYFESGRADAKDANHLGTDTCSATETWANTCRSVLARLLRGVAAVLRNIPFMNTSSEDTRTIGHFDPMRPPFGILGVSPVPQPATIYGTTHEFIINEDPGHGTQYTNAVSPYRSECAIVDHWLWDVRKDPVFEPYGTWWDSGYTQWDKTGALVPTNPPNRTPIRKRAGPIDHLEGQFRHGLLHGGMLPIVQANDPFWNVRAYDTALKEHDGYVSYPLICAINQLVMDDVASPRTLPIPPPGAEIRQ